MAKIAEPYKCDECTATKNPSNGWFLAMSNGTTITLTKWDDSMADNEGVKHLCGIDCAMRYTAKELGRFHGGK